MGKVSQVATIVAAVIGLFTFVLLVALERQQISEWEMWDIFRRGATEDATILIAKLSNDEEGRYTEDMLQWVKQQGKQYYELGRSWKGKEEGDEDAENREQALSRTHSLAVAQLPEAGSAAEMTQDIVGEKARVVAAFHNVAVSLLEGDDDFDCDVLVTGDDISDRREIKKLVEDTGCRPINAGKLANSAASEALTSALIHINKTYKAHSGIKITGVETDFNC